WRMASTAAWSTASLSPKPILRAAAMAAASVTRTSSRARLRSGGSRAARGPHVRLELPLAHLHIAALIQRASRAPSPGDEPNRPPAGPLYFLHRRDWHPGPPRLTLNNGGPARSGARGLQQSGPGAADPTRLAPRARCTSGAMEGAGGGKRSD